MVTDLNYLLKFHTSGRRFSSESNNGACHFAIFLFFCSINGGSKKNKTYFILHFKYVLNILLL